jgi:molybdopterin molybdotransferase
MPEFLSLISPEAALSLLFSHLDPVFSDEDTWTEHALGKVTAEDILSPHNLPEFRRSTVDGYAIMARDSHGASESLPAYLKLAGEVLMGNAPEFDLGTKECVLIHTGGMLPEGANAVVMLEDTQALDGGEIEIYRSLAAGGNVIEIGEDVTEGGLVIPGGTRLRPAEIGGLLALGITKIRTISPPKIGIISSGDEVIPPDQKPKQGEVRDINSYTLGALIRELGAEVVHYGIIPDNRDDLMKILQIALIECDHLIVTAGSSASSRDLTADVMNELGDPGVLVHGVSIKPGKPTIFALAGDKVMIGLPGNPVSALVIAYILVKPIIQAYLGLENRKIYPSVLANLTMNVPSQAGREDWIPVRLIEGKIGDFQAEPIFGRSNLIFLLAKADGLVKIPSPTTGLEAGATVSVQLF